MQPPSDPNAERAILGAVFLKPEAFDAAAGKGLRETDFLDPAHRHIWRVIHDCVTSNEDPDPVAVCSRLDLAGALELCGGYGFVSSLSSHCPAAANVGQYTDTVLRHSRTRSVLDAAKAVLDSYGDDRGVSPESLLSQLESALEPISRGGEDDGKTWAEAAESAYDDLQRRQNEGRTIRGLSTGFPLLDKLTGGLQRGGQFIIAGETGSGKSALAYRILQNAMTSIDAGEGTALVFSYEMTAEQIMDRQLAASASVSAMRIRDGEMKDDDWGPMLQCVEGMQRWGHRITTYDKGEYAVEDIGAIARAANRRADLRILLVDHLLLMPSHDKHEGRPDLDIAHRSEYLKRLAQNLGCCVVPLHQLNGNLDSRTDKRPTLGDLYGSKRVKQAASEVVMVYRPELHIDGNDEVAGKAEAIVRKARYGRPGTVPLHFAKRFVRFEEARE